jgi:hypothetical protein
MRHLISQEKAMIFWARSSVPALVVTLALWYGSGGSVNAACYAPDQQLPAQTVSDFLNNPRQLLQNVNHSSGGDDEREPVSGFS